ncbi:HNH endonuclease [Planctomonas psychrotolerans]|uniref:HNH endonuclease n=1 Tax=Planctomonas psychrotolerans TaxID=2528712 RepID=UPI00123A76FA|nr:HNH endonuclease signature motif containing protein [Planctomonas psychrotolerans]
MNSSAMSVIRPTTVGAEAVGAPMQTATVTALEALGAIVDGVVEFDRLIAWATACRADLIDAAVQWSEATRLAPEAHPSGPRWDPSVVAFRTVVSELAVALRLPDRTAENLVGESTTLVRHLPGTRTALREGRITYRHAQAMIDHALSMPGEARADFEAAVLPSAEVSTVAAFDRRARRVRERAHPESIRERHRASVADRRIEVTPERDGMAWLGARLPAPDALGIHERVTDIALGLQGPDEVRTLAQLRADVFTDLLLDGTTRDCDPASLDADVPPACSDQDVAGAGAGVGAGLHDGSGAATDGDRGVRVHSRRISTGVGSGVRARVFVTVPVLTLLGSSDEPGDLEGYGPIDADTARRLAAGAPGFTRLLTHPETGVVLSVGRDRYAVPNELRTWLRLRDETCRFPGCGRSARRSDIDHTLDWQLSGHTTHDNLAHLCRAHHSLKHQTAWTLRHTGGGALQWTSPTRRSYSTAPATGMRVPDPKAPAHPDVGSSPAASLGTAVVGEDPPPF